MKIYYFLSAFLFSGCTAMMSPLAYGSMEYSYNNAYPATEYSPSEQAYNYSAPQYPPTDYEYRAQQGSNNYEFQRFLSYLSTQTRGRDREKTLRLFVRHSSLTCQQAASILRLTPLEKERLNLLRILAPAIEDMRNAHEILVFFPEKRRQAQRILEFNGPLPQRPVYRPQPGYDHRPQYPGAMSPYDFDRFLKSISDEDFSNRKERLLQNAVRHNRFTCQQVALILRTNDFDSNRNKQLRIVAPAIVDPQNSHLILNAYEFSSGRNDAQRILEDAHRPRTSENIARPFLNPRLQFPMDDNDFAAFARSLEEATFDSDKVNLIKSAIQHNFFTCEQVGKILSFFSFDSERIKQFRLLAPRITNPQNSFTLFSAFTFSSSRDEAKRILEEAQK